jgi:hypothetical protein
MEIQPLSGVVEPLANPDMNVKAELLPTASEGTLTEVAKKVAKAPKIHVPKVHAPKAAKAPKVKVPKVKTATAHSVAAGAHISGPASAAGAVKVKKGSMAVTMSSSAAKAATLGTLIQNVGVHSVGSVATRSLSSAIVTAERLAVAKKMAEQSAEGRVQGQLKAKAEAAAQAQAAAAAQPTPSQPAPPTQP